MPSNELPSVCPFGCGLLEIICTPPNGLSEWECGSWEDAQSDRCKITCLTRDLTAANAQLKWIRHDAEKQAVCDKQLEDLQCQVAYVYAKYREAITALTQQLAAAQAKLAEVDRLIESILAGPRGNADPGWEGDVRFACRIMEEAENLQSILHPMSCVVALTREDRDRLGMAIEVAAMELCRAARADPACEEFYRRAVKMLDDSKMVLFPNSVTTTKASVNP